MFPTSISTFARSWVCVCVSERTWALWCMPTGKKVAHTIHKKYFELIHINILLTFRSWNDRRVGLSVNVKWNESKKYILKESKSIVNICWRWIDCCETYLTLRFIILINLFCFFFHSDSPSNDNTFLNQYFTLFTPDWPTNQILEFWGAFSPVSEALCDVLACQAVLASAQNKSFRGTSAEQPLNPIKSSKLRPQKPLSPLPAGLVEICF